MEIKYIKTFRENGKQVFTREGRLHHNMSTRVNNPKYKEIYPTYLNVQISDNFKDFQYFAKWCNDQIGFKEEDWVLDKDILSKSYKLYSEDTCVFIPVNINGFLTHIRQERNLPIGVSKSPVKGKYRSYCSNLEGKNICLGTFLRIEDAFNSYKTKKEELAKKLAKKTEGTVDPRVTLYLNNFTVEKAYAQAY